MNDLLKVKKVCFTCKIELIKIGKILIYHYKTVWVNQYQCPKCQKYYGVK